MWFNINLYTNSVVYTSLFVLFVGIWGTNNSIWRWIGLSFLKDIRQRRKELGFTIKDMAEHLGYKYPSGYCNLETGVRNMTFIQAVKILQKLELGFSDVDVDQFTLKKLKRYRHSKGFTINMMAEELGYKYPSGYSNIEYGHRMIRMV